MVWRCAKEIKVGTGRQEATREKSKRFIDAVKLVGVGEEDAEDEVR